MSSISSYSISNLLIISDTYLDYIPIVSTVTNLINIIQKCIILPILAPAIRKNRYYKHIDTKKFAHCLFLLVPIIGNIAIPLIKRKLEQDKKREQERYQAEEKQRQQNIAILKYQPDPPKMEEAPSEVVEIDGYEYIKESKQTERRALLDAVKNNAKKNTPDGYKPCIDSGILIQKKKNLSLFLQNYALKTGKSSITRELISNIQKFLEDRTADTTLSLEIQQEIRKIVEQHKEPFEEQYLAQEYERFHGKVHNLYQEIQRDVSDDSELKDKIRQIQLLIRECWSDSAYDIYKYDSLNPAIQSLHQIALAFFIELQPLNHFEKFRDRYKSKSDSVTVKSQFLDFFQHIVDNGVATSKQSFHYITNFPDQIRGIIANNPVGEWFRNYDPHIELENFSGTCRQIELTDIKVRSIITSTPTVGNQIAPEMLIALQAIENNYIEESDSITHWHYTNLQNIISSEERKRSCSIMKLQKQFPLSFSAITIKRDDTEGISAHTIQEIFTEIISKQTPPLPPKWYWPAKKQDPIPLKLNDEYKKYFLEMLLNENNYSLENSAKGTGYFFPIELNDEWKEKLGAIIDSIYDKIEPIKIEGAFLVQENHLTEENRIKIFEWEKKAVFRELVSLKIAQYFQDQSRGYISKNTTGIENMSCKESIDRGPAFLAAFLYGTIEEEDEAKKTALNILCSRALLNAYRPIQLHRVYLFLILTSWFSHNELKSLLKSSA
ncbi:MAG: hypothetical protein QRY74_01400 [Chlamydia sp.]